MAKKSGTKRIAFDGEDRSSDRGSVWWLSRQYYHDGDCIQLRLPGAQHIIGAYLGHNQSGVLLNLGLDGAEELDKLSLGTVLEISEHNEVWFPRRLVLDISRAAIPKSDTPRMAVLKEEFRRGEGDTAEGMQTKLDQFMAAHPQHRRRGGQE